MAFANISALHKRTFSGFLSFGAGSRTRARVGPKRAPCTRGATPIGREAAPVTGLARPTGNDAAAADRSFWRSTGRTHRGSGRPGCPTAIAGLWQECDPWDGTTSLSC